MTSARCTDTIPTRLLRTALTIDQVWVIAALPQLHHGVDEVGHIMLVGTLGEEGEVLLQDGPVVFLLDVGQLHLNDGLLLGCQILLYVVLQPSQHHGLQDGLELLHLPEQAQRFSALPAWQAHSDNSRGTCNARASPGWKPTTNDPEAAALLTARTPSGSGFLG